MLWSLALPSFEDEDDDEYDLEWLTLGYSREPLAGNR
jgi:hypothetical protein